MTFSTVSDLWNKWNTRGFVILSLSLQVFLILYAPVRKKTTYCPIIFLLWLAYLAADWVAPFAIGLITHHQGNWSARATEVDGALQAFWASFLLLHLGGQDTITAFSMEDSWLWKRHLLTLIFQIGAAIYVFVQLFPSDKSLVIPTMLVFLAAIVKNVERTLALHLSSLPKLKESMFKDFHAANNNLTEELNILRARHLEVGEIQIPESIVVKHAYFFFQIFKVFLADLMFTSQQRDKSRDYFHNVSAKDALRVISVELHFMYEVLHTKALVIRSKWSYIFRFIAFTSIVMAFILFNRFKKDELPKLDVKITHILLFGGIALDVMALCMLIFSDWTIAGIMCYSHESARVDSFLRMLVSATDNRRKPQLTTHKLRLSDNDSHVVFHTLPTLQRWSESISACNLLSESLKKCPRMMFVSRSHQGIIMFLDICNFRSRMADKIFSHFHQACERIARGRCLSNAEEKIPMIRNTKYVSKNPLIVELWSFIFHEVKRKSEHASAFEEVKHICDARGDQFLQKRLGSDNIICSDLLPYVTQVNYDDSIIIWHLATEICYNREQHTAKNEEREFSKILSDYMLYLLLNRSDVVSTVAGIAQMRSAETLRLLWDQPRFEDMSLETLCCKLFDLPLTGPILGSQLGQGIRLAIRLDGLGEIKWEVMSGVWAEMLSYAAIHIKGEVHVQVLSKGGELLAFVWLLMAHFGCFYKPEMGMCFENWHERPAEVISSPGSIPHIQLATIQ